MNPETNKINDLLEQKNWEELTSTEKKIVEKSIGKTEYEKMRQTILLLSEKEQVPDVGKFKEKNTGYAYLKRFLKLKVPLYQAAAILVVMLLFSGLIQNKKYNNSTLKDQELSLSNYSQSLQEDSLATFFINSIYR